MSFARSGFPVVVCAPEMTQLLEPAKQESQRFAPLVGCHVLSCLFSDNDAAGVGVYCCSRASADGGRSRHEPSGYKSAACSGASLALICSRECSVGNVVLRLSEILMPTITESTAVHGFGW